jgi:hypothetical protein
MDYANFTNCGTLKSEPGSYQGLNNIFETTKYQRNLDKFIHGRDEYRFTLGADHSRGLRDIPTYGLYVLPGGSPGHSRFFRN